MRNARTMGGLVCGALLMAACGGGGTAGSGSEATARTQGEALSAAPAVVTDYRHVKGVRFVSSKGDAPPTDATCRALYGSPCYSPQEMQVGYGVSELLADGYDGAGQTIVIVDSYGSPTIAADLAQFDADYGLPDPPSFQVISPLGTVPFDPTSSDMQGWAFETTLDVQWAHAMAPGASIVLLTSPVSETEGVQGFPEFIALETYNLDHDLGKIVSQSWAATENTLFDDAGKQVIADFEAVYARARHEHVTVFAGAGDNGTQNQEVDGVTFYSFPTVCYPASSPNVTAVGGTSLTLDVNGNYQSEVVWNGYGASGGGVSQYFAEPSWQLLLPAADQRILGGHRGLPDVTYNADPVTSILVYLSIPGIPPGYYSIGGTSEGSPQWAGLAADFNQIAGRPLGYLNTKLYTLGELGLLKPVLHDITVGNNAYGGVAGYDATAGWDPASGWGSPKLAGLGKLLADLPDDE
jgi:subtilase family serine protease